MDKIKFGHFIKETRIGKGLTQAELAEKLYVDTTTISKWERGINYPDISLIQDICKILDVTEHELIESSRDTEYRKLKYNAKRYVENKKIAFWIYTSMYLLALLTTFIVNLAVEKTLSWFFIVLTSCACGYWATMYPIFNNMIKILLNEEAKKVLSKFSMLIYSSGLLLLTLSILFSTNAYNPFNIEIGVKITLYCFLILFMYGIVELINVCRITKIGIDSLLTGGYTVSLAKVLPWLMNEEEENYFDINFADWQNHTNGNVALIILLSFVIIGITLIILGITKERKNRQKS